MRESRLIESMDRVVVIGAGQAGYAAARALRDAGYDGLIALIGDEPHPPYERPPLSKAVLLGESDAASTYLADHAALAVQCVDWIDDQAVKIDRADRTVRTASGRSFDYDRLLIATGGRPRRIGLPGATLTGVHYLRALSDVAAIRESVDSGGPLVVIGGGWIGLEVAASARKAGIGVELVEVAERLCARSLPPYAAAALLALHRANGIGVRLGKAVRAIIGEDAVAGVELDDGTRLPARGVVVGVGMTPNIEIAASAGLATAQGILVDEDGRTDDPLIFAAGDVAETVGATGTKRTESWANANEQGAAVAAAMLGYPAPPRPPAWFWSDQYGSNIQVLGETLGAGEVIELADTIVGRSWLVIDNARLVGMIAIDRPRDVQVGRRIMQRGVPVTRAALAALGDDLAALLRQAAVASA